MQQNRYWRGAAAFAFRYYSKNCHILISKALHITGMISSFGIDFPASHF